MMSFKWKNYTNVMKESGEIQKNKFIVSFLVAISKRDNFT